MNAGEIQNAVNASNVVRKKAVATRREILLGSNQYPNFTEVAADKIQEKVLAVVAVVIAARQRSRLLISLAALPNSRLCVWRQRRVARLRRYSC